MESTVLTRSYLETLSTEDLLNLADDYGIDFPDNLSRRFIIGELMELSQDFDGDSSSETITEIESDISFDENELPSTYNETFIGSVLRNPVWAFVWWDISASDIEKLESDFDFSSLIIRVSFFDDAAKDSSSAANESFDVNVSFSDRKQYILLPADKKNVRFDLAAVYNGKRAELLKSSAVISIPHGSGLYADFTPGKKIECSKLHELSGLNALIQRHYLSQRQSFSKGETSVL